MSHLFQATTFNEDISRWDVSNVQDMSHLFESTIFINKDISVLGCIQSYQYE